MSHERTGPGLRMQPKLSPEEIAARLENMRKGQKSKAQRAQELADLAVAVSSMTLEQVRKHLTPRLLTIACYALGGMDAPQIARAVGYASRNVVYNVLLRPDVRRFMELVKEAQVQRVIDGEFGVQAAAKVAAPKVFKQVVKRAGGIDAPDGSEAHGVAARDADQIRAAEMVMRVSGDLSDRKEHVHMVWIDQMDPRERQHFIDTGEWPEKYRHISDRLLGGPATIDVTPEK